MEIFSPHGVVFGKTFSSALAYTSRPFSEALKKQPEVLYIPFAISSHEQTGGIITFAQFEERDLVVNERNVSENESISDSIDESSTDNDSDDGYISMNFLKDIQYGNYVHQYINTRDTRLKIHDRIRKTQNEWKGENSRHRVWAKV